MPSVDQSSPRQVGNLPQWSKVERFDRGFWTEAPLVDRSKLVQATHVETGAPGTYQARKRQIPNNTTTHAPDNLQNNNGDPGRRVGTLPQWSVVPRFDNSFWTEAPLVDREKLIQDRHELTKGRKKTPHCPDNLIGAAKVNRDVVPSTPVRHKDNNSGIVRARKTNEDHLTGIAEVRPDAAEIVPRRVPPRSNVDHLCGAASVNYDIVPPIPVKKFANNSGIVETRKVHIDHLVGPAVVNRDIVPMDPYRQRKTVHTHLLGGGAQVNPDSVPLEHQKRLQQPPSNLVCGGCILVEEHLSGRGGLRDWWGHRANASASTSSTPRSSTQGRETAAKEDEVLPKDKRRGR